MARLLRTTTFSEPDAVSDVLKYEDGTYSRDTATILSGSGVLALGMVLGKITKAGASSAAKSGGNTGNGTLTLDGTTPVRSGAKAGVYTVRLITAAANAGTFRVTDPDGFVLGDVGVGATFDNDIKFATADGSSDFIVGDGFDITVAAGSGKWKPHTYGAVDGSEVAAGVLIQKVDATSADVEQAIVITRHAEVSERALKWHASVDDASKKSIAMAQLAALGIVARTAA